MGIDSFRLRFAVVFLSITSPIRITSLSSLPFVILGVIFTLRAALSNKPKKSTVALLTLTLLKFASV